MEEQRDLELGNIIFNTNTNQEFMCPKYVIALLRGIEAKMGVQYWNKHQQEMDSPFSNTANSFKNDVFEVEAYSWDDDYEQPYNFKWKDIEISWYKYLGRDTTINKKLDSHRAVVMFDDCIKSLDNFDDL